MKLKLRNATSPEYLVCAINWHKYIKSERGFWMKGKTSQFTVYDGNSLIDLEWGEFITLDDSLDGFVFTDILGKEIHCIMLRTLRDSGIYFDAREHDPLALSKLKEILHDA